MLGPPRTEERLPMEDVSVIRDHVEGHEEAIPPGRGWVTGNTQGDWRLTDQPYRHPP